ALRVAPRPVMDPHSKSIVTATLHGGRHRPTLLITQLNGISKRFFEFAKVRLPHDPLTVELSVTRDHVIAVIPPIYYRNDTRPKADAIGYDFTSRTQVHVWRKTNPSQRWD